MPEIDYQVNQFHHYEAVVDGISFGFIDSTAGGYSPRKGEVVQYDGTTVVLKDGREFTDVPQLRSAIKEGWLVPIGKGVTGYRPKAAGVKVSATETRGTDRPAKTTIETTTADERSVGSIEDRRDRRERTNQEATRRVPLESQAARDAVDRTSSWDGGDEEVNIFVEALEEDLEAWLDEERVLQGRAEEQEAEEGLLEREEANILAMLNSVEQPEPERASARSLPVEHEDGRPQMPIVQEDSMETGGEVVGRVEGRHGLLIEQEQEIALDTAPAAPKRKETPRKGISGAVVIDEQRDMGQIALSGSSAPVRLDETAQVRPSDTESIKMGRVEVGNKTASSRSAPQGQEGVAVGRVLSPTQTTFTATDANTSSTAIRRTEEGKQLRVERFGVEADQEEAETSGAVATGDVQEARAGDELTDLLPDAAQGAGAPNLHEEDPAYMAVKMMVPDFEWSRDRPLQQRVADALKHVKNPMYMKGILAVETDMGREEIKKALAEALKGKKGKKRAEGATTT